MSAEREKSEWIRRYDLVEARKQGVQRVPAPHQSRSLAKLEDWYRSANGSPRGGILTLPTGGGKTFTAMHFLCRHPLSDGFKVLWLAHTHHLLEQALTSLGHAVPLVSEPRRQLDARVVSGTKGHPPVHTIKPADDVVVCSLQSASRALQKEHPRFLEFLDASNGRLFIVFDEAHHAPAPSYRTLIQTLQTRCAEAKLLGLTATPTYTDKKKQGWLRQLFPQRIIHQETPADLMAADILAKPVLEEAPTQFEPEFDQREYEAWLASYRDLPERIIQHLAENRDRNEFIANYYVNGRERFGKTIIFADRWYQCDQIRQALTKRDVRADVIYSHVDADPGSAEARNRRGMDENARVLRQFRNDELDVLINVRMLTEGTDVPRVQSVFLTRQTTSQILLTQMVGRALRGPEFGGTKNAYIVSFIDSWRSRINWATYDQLAGGMADDAVPEYGKRPPVQLISIDLVRRLASQMDSGVNVNPGPYRTLLPVGWYRVAYEAAVADPDTDDVEDIQRLVLVFEGDERPYSRVIRAMCDEDLSSFEGLTADPIETDRHVDDWIARHFGDDEENQRRVDLRSNLVDLARHVAHRNEEPRFFPFAVRDSHDLDGLAKQFCDEGLNRLDEDSSLRTEYAREDRLWRSFYHNYDAFKSHYDGCMNRMLHAFRHGADPQEHEPKFSTPEALPDREPSDETKKEVKVRDGKRCLCCATTRSLTVDHVSPSYYGGRNDRSNLQTLCRYCNGLKSDLYLNFRNHCTDLTTPPTTLASVKLPAGDQAKDPARWERYLRCVVNFFYRCSAVESVTIGMRGKKLRTWTIDLFEGNDPEWLAPHLPRLLELIRSCREKAGVQAAPDTIRVVE